MYDQMKEVRLALRTILRSPVLMSVAVASLALGIGANTAIFSLTNQILLRLRPVVKAPEQLVLLDWQGPFYGSSTGLQAISYPLYRDVRDRNRVFQGMFCRYLSTFSFGYEGATERVNGEFVSGNYFPVLGVGAALGRTFDASDDLYLGAHPLAMVSYRFWKERLGGDRGIIGSQVIVNGRNLTVVGVVERGFDGDQLAYSAKIFVPIHMKPALITFGGDYTLDNRRGKWVQAYGRLKPGLTARHAEAGLEPLFKSIIEWETAQPDFRRASPQASKEYMRATLRVHPAARGRGNFREVAEKPLVILLCAAGFVLLIACANIANLLLVRASARRQEIAVRLAVGAARTHIIRLLLTESMVIAAAGGIFGLAVAWGGARVLIASLPVQNAIDNFSAAPNARVLAFAMGMTLLAGAASGLAPALKASRVDLNSQLKSGSRTLQGGQATARRGLVVIQVFLSMLLLMGAGLFIRTLRNLRHIDPGFRIEHELVFSVDPTLNGYTRQRSAEFYRELDARLRTLPGVENAGLALVRLLNGDEWDMGITVEGYHPPAGKDAWAYFNAASPGLFPTLGARLLAGRNFTESDLTSPRKVAIVNEAFVEKYFGGRNPIGRHLGEGVNPGTKTDIEVIGVITNMKYTSMRDDEKSGEEWWIPWTQMGFASEMSAYVQTRQNIDVIGGAVRRVVREIDPNVPVYDLRSFGAQLNESLALERLVASLAAGFGTLATLLAAIGLYGVLAFNVGQRTREIGIRIALGAGNANVVWMVMRDVLLLFALGVGLAVPASYALAGVVRSELYGVGPHDPLSTAGGALLLAAVAAMAGYWPARRASRVDPVKALKYE